MAQTRNGERSSSRLMLKAFLRLGGVQYTHAPLQHRHCYCYCMGTALLSSVYLCTSLPAPIYLCAMQTCAKRIHAGLVVASYVGFATASDQTWLADSRDRRTQVDAAHG